MALITPLKAATPPTAATLANSINVSNHMMDQQGMYKSVVVGLLTIQQQLTLMQSSTDPGDPNYAVLTNALAAIA